MYKRKVSVLLVAFLGGAQKSNKSSTLIFYYVRLVILESLISLQDILLHVKRFITWDKIINMKYVVYNKFINIISISGILYYYKALIYNITLYIMLTCKIILNDVLHT